MGHLALYTFTMQNPKVIAFKNMALISAQLEHSCLLKNIWKNDPSLEESTNISWSFRPSCYRVEETNFL